MDKRKCLLLGDYTHPRFHPLQGVDKQISEILNDLLIVQCSENKKLLLSEHLAGYDLCIAYNELWNETVSPADSGSAQLCERRGRPDRAAYGGFPGQAL